MIYFMETSIMILYNLVIHLYMYIFIYMIHVNCDSQCDTDLQAVLLLNTVHM